MKYENPPSYHKFNILNSASNVLLRGSPDAVFVREDGSYMIADYKTARYTKKQDKLLPLYEVQLNAYAAIGEQYGFSPVSDLALIYMEPMTEKEDAEKEINYRDDGFAMGFAAYIHKVELNPKSIPLLLAKVREIYELPSAPDGHDGCDDCQILEKIAAVTGVYS
ncbi:hypothetical protein ES703_123400 [subsurface metagenome]